MVVQVTDANFNCSGYSLNGESVPADDFEWVWQEGINQIQFVIGDASTNEYGMSNSSPAI